MLASYLPEHILSQAIKDMGVFTHLPFFILNSENTVISSTEDTLKETIIFCHKTRDLPQLTTLFLPSNIQICFLSDNEIIFVKPIIINKIDIGKVCCGPFTLSHYADTIDFNSTLAYEYKGEKLIISLLQIADKLALMDLITNMFSHLAAIKMQEAEINTKLDLLVQQETVELLKTNERLKKTIQEITQKEIALQRSNKALKAITACRQILMHATNEYQLLKDICEVIYQFHQCELVWIGYAMHDTAKSIFPVAYSGNKTQLLSKIKISWEDNEYGKGVSSKAIREAEKQIISDITEVGTDFYYKEILLEYGISSTISYPLIINNKAIGVLTLYFNNITAFEKEELNLLSELASDLAFGIAVLRTEEKRQLAEQSLRISDESLRTIFNSVNEGIMIHQPNGNVIEVNEKLIELLQLQTQDGKAKEKIQHYFQAQQIFSILQPIWEKTFEGQNQIVECKLRRQKNFKEFFAELFSRKIIYKNDFYILSTFKDLTERKKYEQEIKKALEKEKELNQARSNFVSTISHEFRTPLSVILSSVQLLEKYNDKWPIEKKESLFNKIYKSINQTNNLLNNVIMVGKDQTGKLAFNPAIIHFEDFFYQLIEETIVVFGHDVKINFIITSDFGEVLMDVNLLRHIFSNLLSNAIKYSKEEKEIQFNVTKIEDNKALIIIEDRGIGISPEDIPYIFEPFQRAKNAEKIQGAGLGMSIVKRCLELHNASIQIQSALNKGTKVIVDLPVEKPLVIK